MFTPSKQQAAFFSWIENESGSCVLEAVAGSGKTTTLIEGLSRMKGSIFFGAYNKKIAEEIKSRSPVRDGLYIATMHAAGFRAWRRMAPRVKVEEKKCLQLFREGIVTEAFEPHESNILKLVSYAKQGAMSPEAPREEWQAMIDHFGMDTGRNGSDETNDETVIEGAKKLLALSLTKDRDVIDFDDMIYAPIAHGANVKRFDWVLIDEAQDTNKSRRILALKMLATGHGRLVAVGDRHQAIYGFTGADSDALDLIGAQVRAKELPLTVTYRCPKAVVREAQKYVSHIEAHESAPEGVVSDVEGEHLLATLARPGNAILCRFNKPLITLVYDFIARGIAAKVEGREIGNGLKALARRWRVTTIDALLKRLDRHEENQVRKFNAKGQETRAKAIEDQCQCLRVIIDRVAAKPSSGWSVVEAICAEIDAIFGDSVGTECVLLSTIHKSKGREWGKVFWLQTGASSWAKQEWELEQERNLMYVAATRAKSELFLVAMR